MTVIYRPYQPTAPDFAQSGFLCTICRAADEPGNEETGYVAHGKQHPVHKQCIQQWLEQHPSCPTCRAPVDVTAGFSWQERTTLPLNLLKNDALFGVIGAIGGAAGGVLLANAALGAAGGAVITVVATAINAYYRNIHEGFLHPLISDSLDAFNQNTQAVFQWGNQRFPQIFEGRGETSIEAIRISGKIGTGADVGGAVAGCLAGVAAGQMAAVNLLAQPGVSDSVIIGGIVTAMGVGVVAGNALVGLAARWGAATGFVAAVTLEPTPGENETLAAQLTRGAISARKVVCGATFMGGIALGVIGRIASFSFMPSIPTAVLGGTIASAAAGWIVRKLT